jgi:TRAP-type C4-dicarboxylate transport system permease large subunit
VRSSRLNSAERVSTVSHETISRAASTATYTGATLSFSSAAAGTAIPPGVQETIFGLTLNQWTVLGIVFGMLMAVAGLAVNWYYRRAQFKLAESRVNEAAPDGD